MVVADVLLWKNWYGGFLSDGRWLMCCFGRIGMVVVDVLLLIFCSLISLVVFEFQVAIAVWIASFIGSLFNFITLVFIGELLCCPSSNKMCHP
jgi:hypothetical protein